ncbi:MAG TPA: phosphoglycolate phosphatase [Patescibacteria group bacterium]|nr:phosphoglycolate phosphatase [Patescibacteria group bacterium]
MTQIASRPAAIVFDLDGTLVDSLPDMLRAMNGLLADLGRRAARPDEIRGWVGDGARVLVEHGLAATGGLPDQPVAELVARYIDHYRGHAAHETRLYPGVRETLEGLKAAGHRLAVCTNKPYALAVEVLEGLELSDLFVAVLGGDSVAVKKPDPGHLRATLAAMGAAEGRALMVGDSSNDVAAARGAGVPVVAVSFGYARIDPRQLGADEVIDNFTQLPVVAARFL